MTKSIENGSLSPHDDKYYQMALLHTQKRGIKVVLGCVCTIIVSVMLFMGAKNNKSLYFVPWMTEQIIALCVGVIKTVIMAMGGFLNHVGAFAAFFGFLIFLVNGFLIYSTVSHFVILRKMKKHSKEIIQSVMNSKQKKLEHNYFEYESSRQCF